MAEDEFVLEDLKIKLCDYFETIDYTQAKEDVKPFIRNHDSLQVWNSNFFKQIT